EPAFDFAEDFAEGLAAVEIDHEYGYIDGTGRIIIKLQFPSARSFAEGLAVVATGDHRSYIDKTGKVVIRGRFNDAEPFRRGPARGPEGGEVVRTLAGPVLWRGGAWTYINAKGDKVRRYRTDDD